MHSSLMMFVEVAERLYASKLDGAPQLMPGLAVDAFTDFSADHAGELKASQAEVVVNVGVGGERECS